MAVSAPDRLVVSVRGGRHVREKKYRRGFNLPKVLIDRLVLGAQVTPGKTFYSCIAAGSEKGLQL